MTTHRTRNCSIDTRQASPLLESFWKHTGFAVILLLDLGSLTCTGELLLYVVLVCCRNTFASGSAYRACFFCLHMVGIEKLLSSLEPAAQRCSQDK
jgi:hypothetical protein